MRNLNILIHVRDNFLDFIFGVNRNHMLNSANGTFLKKANKPDLAAELKRALDKIKAQSIDEQGSKVDYASLRGSAVYNEFRHECSPKLREFDPGSLDDRDEKLAFWINLYNALVLDAVISFGVQHSVTEGWLGALAFFRKAAYNVGSERLSLDDIEHGILRGNRGHPLFPGPQFAANDRRLNWVISPPDVRIHFALNCASRSCPPIQVYSGKQIGSQLELTASHFVSEITSVQNNRRELWTSAIFRWYQGDFGGEEEVVRFVLSHLPNGELRSWITKNLNALVLRYTPYDWNLNI
jgi:hypothetical protein